MGSFHAFCPTCFLWQYNMDKKILACLGPWLGHEWDHQRQQINDTSHKYQTLLILHSCVKLIRHCIIVFFHFTWIWWIASFLEGLLDFLLIICLANQAFIPCACHIMCSLWYMLLVMCVAYIWAIIYNNNYAERQQHCICTITWFFLLHILWR